MLKKYSLPKTFFKDNQKLYKMNNEANQPIAMTIKALKMLVWHLSRKPIKEMSSLKNKQTVMYDEQVQTIKAKD